MTNNRLTSKSPEWYTPSSILDPAREVLGGIDVDPFSSALANQTVGATEYYSGAPGYDGFLGTWGYRDRPQSVWVNPPGGKVLKAQGLPYFGPGVKLAWSKLLQEVQAGHVSHALFLCFSMEAAQTTQIGCPRSILDFPCLWPSKRIAYVDGAGQKVSGNTHGSVLVYVSGTLDRTQAFIDAFKHLGRITPAAYCVDPLTPAVHIQADLEADPEAIARDVTEQISRIRHFPEAA